MLDTIYLWLESRTGIPYDFDEEIEMLDSDIVVTDTATWALTIFNIITMTRDAIDAVTEYADQIPPDLPNARKIKSVLAENTRINLRAVMKRALSTLGLLTPDSMSSASLVDIRNMVCAIMMLVDTLSENSVEDLSKNGWFDKYEENNNDILTDSLEITEHDLFNIQLAINSVRELYSGLDDEE